MSFPELRTHILRDQWPSLRREIELTWGVFTDEELPTARMSWAALIASIRRKTGEVESVVEAKLSFIVDRISDHDLTTVRPLLHKTAENNLTNEKRGTP